MSGRRRALRPCRHYPASVDSVRLELRAYDDSRFYVTDRECRDGRDWVCRWGRHDSPHNACDHFHEPPDASSDAVGRAYPDRFPVTLGDILAFVDDRVEAVWERE